MKRRLIVIGGLAKSKLGNKEGACLDWSKGGAGYLISKYCSGDNNKANNTKPKDDKGILYKSSHWADVKYWTEINKGKQAGYGALEAKGHSVYENVEILKTKTMS